ncbi:hypothetical protein BJ912DRAFT_162568 [Pholiota molesta]|nr:hypothetical protein BJ912DRAFT_162568 [Pholiota molesta]
MAEPSILSDDDKSSWITRDIDSQWRLSKLVPEACRLLLLSIHINRLVAKRADYDRDDIIEIDWEKILRGHFSDLGLRSILGASVCRGLLHGEKNVKRICAYGLAMIIEIESTTATASPEPIFFGPVDDMSKVIIERLWDELAKMWKNEVLQLVCQTRSQLYEENLGKLLDHELYQSDIRTISVMILNQLESESWIIRKQAVQVMIKLAEQSQSYLCLT